MALIGTNNKRESTHTHIVLMVITPVALIRLSKQVFTGEMPFLSSNQQHQSIDALMDIILRHDAQPATQYAYCPNHLPV